MEVCVDLNAAPRRQRENQFDAFSGFDRQVEAFPFHRLLTDIEPSHICNRQRMDVGNIPTA